MKCLDINTAEEVKCIHVSFKEPLESAVQIQFCEGQDLYLSIPLLFGTYMQKGTLIIWKLFNGKLHIKCVVQ